MQKAAQLPERGADPYKIGRKALPKDLKILRGVDPSLEPL